MGASRPTRRLCSASATPPAWHPRAPSASQTSSCRGGRTLEPANASQRCSEHAPLRNPAWRELTGARPQTLGSERRKEAPRQESTSTGASQETRASSQETSDIAKA
eukprot:6199434-Pyramimonas_sp.AAC.1